MSSLRNRRGGSCPGLLPRSLLLKTAGDREDDGIRNDGRAGNERTILTRDQVHLLRFRDSISNLQRGTTSIEDIRQAGSRGQRKMSYESSEPGSPLPRSMRLSVCVQRPRVAYREFLVRLSALIVALAIHVPSIGAQDRPLPDLREFLPKVRARLHTDERLLSQYTYLEHRTELHLSRLGKLTSGPENVYEVYPGNDLIPTYRRLIETDGRPTPKAELERADRDHRKKVTDAIEKRQRESAADREKRLNRIAKDRAHEEQVFEDLERAYDFTLVGRQSVDGRPAIVFDFFPSARAKVLTDEGKLMLKVKGRAWASEDDYELARVEVEMLDDFSVFLGLAGKLYRGSTASLERRKFNGEVWLPAEATFHGTGRAFIRHFRVDTTIRYSDYRKYAVETDTTFAFPGERQ